MEERFAAEMERLFEGMRGGSPRPWRDSGFDDTWLPDIEVFEKKGNLVVRADVPGMTKDDITVTIADETLTIEGERKLDETDRSEGHASAELIAMPAVGIGPSGLLATSPAARRRRPGRRTGRPKAADVGAGSRPRGRSRDGVGKGAR